MAIYIHTFNKPVFVANFNPEKIDWQQILRTNPNSEMSVPPRWKDDISSDISVGPRRSVLVTFESIRNRNDTVGELEVYQKPAVTVRLKKESEAKEREIPLPSIRIDESHPFAPVYQPGNEGALIYRVVKYMPFAEIRVEDRSQVLAYA